jgi:biopolymer transport protein ExbD
MAGNLDRGDDTLSENHEINVTPFIDVMLVLLIIFMVAAPLATVDIPVELPVANAKQQQRPNKPVFLTIKSDFSISLGNEPVPRPGLMQALETMTKSDRTQPIFLRADKMVPYGELMRVMNVLRGAGFLKVALVGLEDGAAAGASAPHSGDQKLP